MWEEVHDLQAHLSFAATESRNLMLPHKSVSHFNSDRF
jgi:hypothetical protein